MDKERIEIDELDENVKQKNKRGKKHVGRAGGIIAWTVILLLISAFFVGFKYFNTVSLNLTAHFSSVSHGKNPDGSPFDVSEMLCDEILERTSEKLDGKIDVDTLREHISIVDNFTNYDLVQIRDNIESGNTDYTYFPNMYTVTYSIVSEGHTNKGIVDSVKSVIKQSTYPDKKEILKCFAESVCEFYDENYIANGAALKLDWSKADDKDYYNKAAKTKSYAERISRFLLEKYNNDPEYVASNGKGFGDVYTEVEQFISIDVNNYVAYIVQNGLTRDKAALLRQFTFMEDMNNETNLRKTAEYDISKEAIDIYDSNTTKVLFIPALDDLRAFYMNRTKVGIDYLFEIASESKTLANDAMNNAIRYNYLKQHFSVVPDAPESAYDTADKMYEELKEKLDSIVETAGVVVTDASQTYQKENILVGDVYRSFSTVSMAIHGAKRFVMLAIVVFLLSALFTVGKKKNKKEAE